MGVVDVVDSGSWAGCSDDALTGAVARLSGLVAATQAQVVGLLAELDRRGVWRGDGAVDLGAWVTALVGVAPSTGRVLAEAARSVDEVPELVGLLADGSLSLDQFDAARRWVSGSDGMSDGEVAAVAVGLSVTQLRRRARRARPPVGGGPWVRWRRSGDGSMVELHARLDAVAGAEVTRVLAGVAEQVPLVGPDGLVRPLAERCADALVELVLSGHATTTPTGHDPNHPDANHPDRGAPDPVDPDRGDPDDCAGDGAPGGDRRGPGGPGSPGPGPVVVDGGPEVMVHVTVDTDGALVGEVELGGVVPGSVAERLLCGCRWQVVAHDPDGRVVGIGRAARTPPAWLRHLLADRDGGCRFPGCGSTRWLHAHHMRHWTDGGETDLDNLILVCGTHHRFLHDHHWQVRGSPDHHLSWHRPDGTVYQPPPTTVLDDIRRRLWRTALAA